MIHKCIGRSLVASLIAVLSTVAFAQGAGDLLIAPTRVVFEKETRSVEVTVVNIGDKQAIYRVSLVHQRMGEDGKIEEITTPQPGELFADDLIRFTPKQVVLDPHGSQLVRIQLRLPVNLATGEYRSHLLFRAVPAGEASATGLEKSDPGLSIKLTPIYGVTIPVIVRHGPISAAVRISDLKLTPGSNGMMSLTGTFERSGEASCYGDVKAVFRPNVGPPEALCAANGLAVYSPAPRRKFEIRFAPRPGLVLEHGAIHLTYRLPAAGGQGLIADADIVLP